MLYIVLNLLSSVSLQQIFVLAVVLIYFGSVNAFMNGSCNYVCFIKYQKQIYFEFSIVLSYTSKQYSVLWSIDVIFGKAVR